MLAAAMACQMRGGHAFWLRPGACADFRRKVKQDYFADLGFACTRHVNRLALPGMPPTRSPELFDNSRASASAFGYNSE